MTVTSKAAGPRILIFAPTGRDGQAVAALLQSVELPSETCVTLSEMVQKLGTGTAAAFIAEEGLVGPDLTLLRKWVGEQPAWSDLPFVVLTSRREQTTAVSAWRRNLVAWLRNVSLLERPVQSITLTSTLQACVRARLHQYEVRDLLLTQANASADLESLVLERTADLAAANQQLHATNLELRAHMAERAKAEESLRQAQKIEALGQLTGGVAHDFNNLLMVISGGLEMLGRPIASSRRERLMDGMRRAADRGAGLTRQLLAFSRRQPLRSEPVDLARQIGGMRELLDRSLRGDIHVDLAFPKDLWPVEVDPGELELVVLNLAVNARDAMPEGGTITLQAKNAASSDGDFVRLSVIDPGTGMPESIKNRVFEPFFTTKEIGRGSGLGLAQVHGFATQSGGRVEIESAPGLGTTVSLLLPRSSGSPAITERHLLDFTSDDEAKTAGSVLVVEDDDEVAALVNEMLGQLGYKPTWVASAKAALGALADGRPIDIVFSDIMMPGGMNGLDLARELRDRRPNLPLVLTSGYADAARREAAAAGIALLPKPYTLRDLAAALDDAIADRALQAPERGNGVGGH
jgi:signal transduction histidine kinase/CheY-like chemotaxis protein